MKKQILKLNLLVVLVCVGIFVDCKPEKENNDFVNKIDFYFEGMRYGDQFIVYKDYNDWLYGTNPVTSATIDSAGNPTKLNCELVIPGPRETDYSYTLYYDVFSSDYSCSNWSKEGCVLLKRTINPSLMAHFEGYWIRRSDFPASRVNVHGRTLRDKPFVEYKAIKDLAWINNDSADLEQRLIMWKDYRFELKSGKAAAAEYTLKYQMLPTDTNKSKTTYRFYLDNPNFSIVANWNDSTMDVNCKYCGKDSTSKSYRYKMQ